MLAGLLDDIRNWSNYTPYPSVAETTRLRQIVGDPKLSTEFLDFGLRPLSTLDEAPDSMSRGDLEKPFEVLDSDLNDEPLLVDIVTGFRYRFLPDEGGLLFDIQASANFIDAIELLLLAGHRGKEFPFEWVKRPTYVSGKVPYISPAHHVLPLTLRVSSRSELEHELNRLTELFCVKCPRTRKLWLRGQRSEYLVSRSEDICQRTYGTIAQPSLLPSAGRYAMTNPDRMGFGLAFGGANHYWKKPFLIWLMRANAHWFERDKRALDVLTKSLAAGDQEFTYILMAIQMGHALPEIAALAGGVSWPDEADDLRQWFFAHMKPHSFGITLQQYGYVTSLLDLTEDLEVALYFTQAKMVEQKMRKLHPEAGRLIYVFAERSTGDFFRHREQLFWGDSAWVKARPPRLENQKAGFMMGSTCRTQNLYGNMIVARIFLENDSIQSSIRDDDLFPDRDSDLLYSTLLDSRPSLEGLY